MKIGILSRREVGLVEKLKKEFQIKGNKTTIYTHKNLIIDKRLLNNDLYILKSKKEIFLYAAYYLESEGISVFPSASLAYQFRHKIQAHHLLKKIGLLCPDIFIGKFEDLKAHINPKIYPLVKKPIMGSEGLGVRVINSIEELSDQNDILYLETCIEGSHFNVQFIEDEINQFEKEPFSTGIIKAIPLDEDVKNVVLKLRDYFKEQLLFGHIDIIREKSTNKLYTVDMGTFPQFANWKTETNFVQKLCKIILEQIK